MYKLKIVLYFFRFIYLKNKIFTLKLNVIKTETDNGMEF